MRGSYLSAISSHSIAISMAADESISPTEESQIRQIASELGFSHRDYVVERSRYSEYREVMRSFRRKAEEGSAS